MRDLIMSAAVTLDGFMAGPANDLDFMVIDEELDQTMMTDELAPRADTIVIGRKVFPDMATYWTTATGPLARWMNETPKVVLSNTLDDTSLWPTTSVARGNGAAAVEELKRQPGGAIVVFGGVQTVRSLVAAGIVDEFWLKVNPVAIGRGGPVFADLKDPAKLELLSARAFPSGTVGLVYRKRAS